MSQDLFLYTNITEIVITTDGIYTDNRAMNNTVNLIAHKGLTNEIVFSVRNRDRQLQNVGTDTLVAHITDPNTNRRIINKILDHTGEGLLKLVLTASDLQNVIPGLFTMYISNNDTPIYSNQSNNIRFNINITNEADQEPIPTQVVNSFSQESNSNIFASSTLLGNVDRNFEEGLHTFAFYPESYTGNLTIQGSLVEQSPASDTDWFDINVIEFANANTVSSLTVKQFNVNWIRILTFPVTGNIDQVLLRN